MLKVRSLFFGLPGFGPSFSGTATIIGFLILIRLERAQEMIAAGFSRFVLDQTTLGLLPLTAMAIIICRVQNGVILPLLRSNMF